ncbi:MAG: COG0488: ATPase components of ABC transporters with duplicated ATPase domains [uncultured Sulfurovum sp.]|uniref:COG0488: ATPase components of ABC transporters with duplicated ATPase domains n=2 Tax=uncultured Sulfurovum sp. TaxID=269237 RepID=A0A6S6TWI7_9BACT|nr:MAG: COG0488: ATPase components of ABC transporters with duplicated ATPase domains [uncultured Sulfurovum sp.]
MIQLTNLSKSFGGQTLFRDLNLKMSSKQKIGLIGRNGSGKSTLFKIILDEESHDTGEVLIPKNYKIGTLKQHLVFTEKTVREECSLVLSEEEQYNFYKIEKILFGLGFTAEDLEKDPLSFSGGYQIRINLAKLLATEPNMLLLDEPTNYLDLLSLRWLKQFIRTFDGEVIIITHDREFMDAVTTHTMGIQRKSLHLIQGNTTKYDETLALSDETYEKTRQNQEKKRKELEEFVAKNKARASTAALAQSKQKMLDKMEEMESLESESNLAFNFKYKETPAKITLRAENLGFGYKEDEPLFQNVTFALENGKTLAIIGKNGKGKSTLLNYIAGELPEQQGKKSFHPSTSMAHFGQTNIERLNTSATIIDEIASVDLKIGIAETRSICGTMMFSGDLADKKISVLSGGERSRVMLGKIIATESNLLLLDEPTNHLDMYSIDSLCTAIEEFKGSTIMVTHSEMLLHRLADALVIFHKGGAEYFDGSYQEFLEKIGWEEEGDVSTAKSSQSKVEVKPKVDNKERKRLKKELTQARSKENAPHKKELEFCETKIMELEEELESENERLVEASNSGDNSVMIEASQNVGKLQAEVDELFERLETASEALDAIEEKYAPQMAELE